MNTLWNLNALWNRYAGPVARRVVVLGMFLGLPLYVWWVATGLIPGLELGAGISSLLVGSVVATLAFGGVSAFLVWRDLDLEP